MLAAVVIKATILHAHSLAPEISHSQLMAEWAKEALVSFKIQIKPCFSEIVTRN